MIRTLILLALVSGQVHAKEPLNCKRALALLTVGLAVAAGGYFGAATFFPSIPNHEQAPDDSKSRWELADRPWEGLKDSLQFDYFDQRDAEEKKAHSEKERKTYFSKMLQQRVSLNDLFNVLESRKSNLVLLGERHDAGLWTHGYSDLLVDFKKRFPNLKYIFLEGSSNKQPDVERIFSDNSLPDEYLAKFGLFHLLKATRAVHDMGVKIILVDHPNVVSPGVDMFTRNQYMADLMAKVLKEDPGAMGVLIVGKDHLSTIYEVVQRKEFAHPIQQLAEKSGVRPYSVNVVVSGEAGNIAPKETPYLSVFFPEKNSPVLYPRPPRPTQVFVFGNLLDAEMAMSGRRNVPTVEEWTSGTRPFYWSDTDGVLLYNPSAKAP